MKRLSNKTTGWGNTKNYYKAVLMLLITFIGLNQSVGQVASQESSAAPDTLAGDIHLSYKYYGDSTVIRWGFDHPQLWYHHLYHPVTLWRRDVTNSGEYEKVGEFMPWDSIKMESTASLMAQPGMLIVVLENLHRHWSNTLYAGYASILERNDNFYNRWSLVHMAADRDATAATAAGLRYVDKSAKPKVTYAYKVVTDGNTSSDYKVAFPVKKNFQPVLFDITEGDSVVILSWEKKLHDYHFSAYWIEQSSDGKNYQRLHEAPYIQMTDASIKGEQRFYAYSVPTENYRKKHYRIVGIDAFGDESVPSAAIVAMGRDKTPPAVPVLWADTTMMHHAKILYWSHSNPADVKTYQLERNFANQSVIITDWAKPTSTKGKDTLTIEGIYRYRLIAVDTAGNQSFSQPVYTKVYDLTPPSAPQKPQVLTDTSGLIMLTWGEHPEPDIIGYNIYAADGASRNFIKLNQHIYRSRLYTDTVDVHMLNEKRYYRITAVDNDYMISEPSEVLIVERPDVIPPAPALIGEYRVLQEGIRLTLLPSSSRDVVRHELRRKDTLSDWQVVLVFDSIAHPTFLDTTVLAATDYTYQFIAIDRAGLESHSVKDIMLTSMPDTISTPELSYSLASETANLVITPSNSASISRYTLYRAIGEGQYVRHASLNTNAYQEQLRKGIVYRYRVRPVSDEGRPGPFSNEVKVQIPTE